MCARSIAAEHDHLIELKTRQLSCACPACAVLFSGQTGMRHKRVPRRVRLLEDFRMSDAQWDGLRIPINLAFFFHSSTEGRTLVFYPSPAGPTESLLPLDTWQDVVRDNDVLQDAQTDVEALLVNRSAHARGAGPAEYYLLGIDECYRLVGLIRARWKGLHGGSEVWQSIGDFFDELRRRARAGGGHRA